MRKFFILPLLSTLLCLSSCSFHGETKIFLNAETLYNNEVNINESSFDEIDANIKGNNQFCVYISKEDCDACSQFKEVYKNVLKETRILSFRLEVHNDVSLNGDIAKLFENYPSFDTGEAPSFFVCNGTKIEQIPFSRLTSNTKFKNALREKLTLSNIYYTHKADFDYQEFANKLKKDVLVVSVNLFNPIQLSGYLDFMKSINSTTLVHHTINALTLTSFNVQTK